jgi:hypothetical protein
LIIDFDYDVLQKTQSIKTGLAIDIGYDTNVGYCGACLQVIQWLMRLFF